MSREFFWVNHKQTAKQEIENGYIWSPKLNKNGSANFSYENMKKVKPNDIIFSYARKISYIGIVKSVAISASKPDEFGKVGDNWDEDGWKIEVDFKKVPHPISPKDYIEQLSPFLADKYAPIQKKTGYGNQGCYLAHISHKLGLLLLEILSADLLALDICKSDDLEAQTDINIIKYNEKLSPRTKKQLIEARIGQGEFRKQLTLIKHYCFITHIEMPELLRASHIKPWKDSNDKEKLDPYNGLLLAVHIDALFDKGFISFEDSGEMMVSNALPANILEQLSIKKINAEPFLPETCYYLKWHREKVFKT